ncbi:MAG TPA: hypothetical protein VNF99_22510 [Stellaceae bacterium]|nr:hypothetical protein [Stellaceae bacterium]
MGHRKARTSEEAASRERWVSLAAGLGLAIAVSVMLMVPIADETRGSIDRQDGRTGSLIGLVFHNMDR